MLTRDATTIYIYIHTCVYAAQSCGQLFCGAVDLHKYLYVNIM